MRPQDFIRNCLLTFPVIVAFILNLIRKSIQVELNNFTSILSLRWVSKQAFSAARQKLSPTVFVELNKTLVSEFYTDNEFKTMFGCRIIGIDGSTLQLPNNEKMKRKYGACSNQSGENFPMARTSFAYDLLNGITLDALVTPYVSSEKEMAVQHLQNIKPIAGKDLYIFDRGYPASWLIFFHVIQGADFLMRCNTQFIDDVNKLVKSGCKDGLIELTVNGLKRRQRAVLRSLIPNLDLKLKVTLRVVVVQLNTGKDEILITTVCNQEQIRYEEFADFYHLRWGIEENYKLHKALVEIENFSGESPVAIEQDFHATIFAVNVQTLLAEEALKELKREKGNNNCKINKSVSTGLFKDQLIKCLFSCESNLELFCNRIKEQMKKSTIPIQNGREYLRLRKKNWRRKFHKNRRRCL